MRAPVPVRCSRRVVLGLAGGGVAAAAVVALLPGLAAAAATPLGADTKVVATEVLDQGKVVAVILSRPDYQVPLVTTLPARPVLDPSGARTELPLRDLKACYTDPKNFPEFARGASDARLSDGGVERAEVLGLRTSDGDYVTVTNEATIRILFFTTHVKAEVRVATPRQAGGGGGSGGGGGGGGAPGGGGGGGVVPYQGGA